MRKAIVWIVIMLVLGMALNISAQAAGTESGIVSQAVNGVVQVYAQTQLSNGREIGATGSAFGVGTIGEETDIFVTNRHVVTQVNQDGSLTQAQRVYIMVGEMPSPPPSGASSPGASCTCGMICPRFTTSTQTG